MNILLRKIKLMNPEECCSDCCKLISQMHLGSADAEVEPQEISLLLITLFIFIYYYLFLLLLNILSKGSIHLNMVHFHGPMGDWNIHPRFC